VGFVHTVPDRKLPDSPKTRHGESSPGLWRIASASKNMRSPLRNLAWRVCSGAPFDDRPRSSPCRASLARKSGDALSLHHL
jgi:hypothetical protein